MQQDNLNSDAVHFVLGDIFGDLDSNSVPIRFYLSRGLLSFNSPSAIKITSVLDRGDAYMTSAKFPDFFYP